MSFSIDITVKDPSEDREEFEKRIDSILEINRDDFFKNAMHALLSDDPNKINEYKLKYSNAMQKKLGYLTSWDNALDKNSKQVIVSSVRKD